MPTMRQAGTGAIAAPQQAPLLAPCRPVVRPFINSTPSSSRCTPIHSPSCPVVGSSRRITVTRSAVETAPPPTTQAQSDASSNGAPSTAYPFPEIEKKWQDYWAQHKTFRTPDDVDTSKPKYFVLDMFPYPR